MSATPRRRLRGRSGFTMIEMMFAMVILASGLLAMLTMQLHALREGKYGRHTTEAMQVARDQMEFLTRLPWGDPAAAPTGWTVATPMVLQFQNDQGAVQQQVFNVSWRITTAGFDADLRLIDVDVQWNEADAPPGAPPRRYVLSSNRVNPN